MKRVNFTCEFCVFWVSGNLYITICIPFLGSMPMELYADRYMPPRASDHWELSTIAFLVQLAPMCDLATNLPGGESNPWFGGKMNMFTFWSVCATYWLFVLNNNKIHVGNFQWRHYLKQRPLRECQPIAQRLILPKSNLKQLQPIQIIQNHLKMYKIN